MVDFLLYEASLDASPAILSKMSLTKELKVNKETGQHTANGVQGSENELRLTSRSSWPCWRYQCLGEPASRPCRCM